MAAVPDAGEATDDAGLEASGGRARHRSGGRWKLAVGAVLLAVGVGAVAVSVLGGDDEPTERPVGRLVATDLGSGEGEGEGDATTTTTVASSTPILGEPQWPSATAGRPAALGGQGEPPPADAGDLEDGFYLWQDFNGWHLFVVGGTDADQVTIAGDDTVSKAEPTGGSPRIEIAGNAVTFARGGAGEEVVGMDFNPGYFAKTLVVTVEGDLRLHVGARRYVVADYYGIQYSAAST
jgi:hypothetical protein